MFIRIYNIDSLVMNTHRKRLAYNADIVYYEFSNGDVQLLKNRWGECGRMSRNMFNHFLYKTYKMLLHSNKVSIC